MCRGSLNFVSALLVALTATVTAGTIVLGLPVWAWIAAAAVGFYLSAAPRVTTGEDRSKLLDGSRIVGRAVQVIAAPPDVGQRMGREVEAAERIEPEASAGQVVHGGGLPGCNDGMPERDGRDQRTELYAAGMLRQPGERRPQLQAIPVDI
jgi:hypothetical protein